MEALNRSFLDSEKSALIILETMGATPSLDVITGVFRVETLIILNPLLKILNKVYPYRIHQKFKIILLSKVFYLPRVIMD